MKNIMMVAIALLTLSLSGCGGSGGSGGNNGPTQNAVTFRAGGNGTLTGTTSQMVTSGGNTTEVTAEPAAGYYFVNWTGDGGFVTTTTNPLTLTNVTASQNITANFALYPSSAVLKLSSFGTLASGSFLKGIDVTVQLPVGVSVSADANNVVSAGVVTASGVAANSSVTIVGYVPASAAEPATLEFLITSDAAGGFGVGEFATVNCLIAAGHFPTAADFIVPTAGFKPADNMLQPATGLTPGLTAVIN